MTTIEIDKYGCVHPAYVNTIPGKYALYNPATQIVVERAKVEDARYSDECIGIMVRAAMEVVK